MVEDYRHAAAEIRAHRLRHLVGEDAVRVTVSTCHALAMRLVGASFAGGFTETRDFDAILRDAVRLITGEGLSRAEAEAQREAVIQGYRWILVDEYQDIGPEEYALIAAVAGRSLDDPDQRLSLFAVGDDDQIIYAFTGASVSFRGTETGLTRFRNKRIETHPPLRAAALRAIVSLVHFCIREIHAPVTI